MLSCCSVASKFPSGQITIISISADISSELAITQMENQYNNNHLISSVATCVVYTYAYVTQLAYSVSLKETLWPLWPLCHVSRTPSDPTRAVMKGESWQRLFHCEITTRSSQDTGCGGTETQPAQERIMVALSLRLCADVLRYYVREKPGHTTKFSLVWSHQSIDQPFMAAVRIAWSCWLQAENKRDSSFAYARQRIGVVSLFTHTAQPEKWFNAVGK